MDMVEWDIKTTRDKCPHIQNIYGEDFNTIIGCECDHWDNPTKSCASNNCPIIIKKSCSACRGKGVLKAPDDIYDTCYHCNGSGFNKI